MSALLVSLLGNSWHIIAGIGAVIIGALGIYAKGRSDAKAKAERDRLKREAAAREDRLEMHREATEAERKAGGMTDDQAKAEAMKWARR